MCGSVMKSSYVEKLGNFSEEWPSCCGDLIKLQA